MTPAMREPRDEIGVWVRKQMPYGPRRFGRTRWMYFSGYEDGCTLWTARKRDADILTEDRAEFLIANHGGEIVR